MSQVQRKTGLRQWLAERYPLSGVLDWAREKHVPQHRYTLWYALGGMLLFMLGLQILTGLLLAFYYHPAEDSAYKSILTICGAMPFGWAIRSLHAWTANIMIAVALAHLFSVWLLRSFRKPRELTWVTGLLALGLLMAFGFSGYLLPWDELAFFATKVGTKIVGSIPVVGYRLMTFLRGGEDVSGDTLSRFFAFHVCLLPLLVSAVAGLHVLLIQIQGVSVPPSVEEEKCPKIPFFPDFVLHDMRMWLVLFGALVTLAVAVPWGIGKQANPLSPAPAGIRPEWYFLSMYQVFKLLPTRILGIEGEIVGTVVFMAAGAVLLGLPFLFRKTQVQRGLSVCTALALAAIIFIASFTLFGYISSEREKTHAAESVAKSSNAQAAAVAKSLAAARAKVEQERGPFLIYSLGLWACIAFLVVVIQRRLAHSERIRQAGLGDSA